MTWHAVLDGDRRAHDFDDGAVSQTHLTDTVAAGSGLTLNSFTGSVPSNMAVGMHVDLHGVVSPPAVDNHNELLDHRKDKVEQWILRNIPTRDFAAYARFVDPGKAAAFEAVCRATYYRTLIGSILASDTYWTRLNAHSDIDYLGFDLLVHLPSWTSAIQNNLRNGTAWYHIEVGTQGDETGLYIPVLDGTDHNWPPTYTHQASFGRQYLELLARVRESAA